MDTSKERLLAERENTPKRKHRATYATDKRKGGYLIRVVGEYPDKFAGREIPVTRKDHTESREKLVRLIWSGPDSETGELVSLYTFAPKPRDDAEQLEF